MSLGIVPSFYQIKKVKSFLMKLLHYFGIDRKLWKHFVLLLVMHASILCNFLTEGGELGSIKEKAQ